MKVTVNTTIDDLIRALRVAAHAGADHAADRQAEAIARERTDRAEPSTTRPSDKDTAP